jgi:hypothetical protein
MSTSSSTPRWDELVASILADASARLRAAAESYARRETEALHHAARRLRFAQDHAVWAATLAEAAAAHLPRAIVFALDNRDLRLAAVHPAPSTPPPSPLPLSSAPALAEAVTSAEPVAALRAPSELGPSLAAWFDSAFPEGPFAPAPARFTAFPIEAHGRIAALLYAEESLPADAPRLELLADLAGAMLDRRSASASNLVSVATLPPAPPRPSWEDLPPETKRIHLKAQRTARVLAATIRLYHEPLVESGRSQKDLYRCLQSQIDAAREAYRTQFLHASPPLPDYLHLELLRTLADDDESLLGSAYPGPLV